MSVGHSSLARVRYFQSCRSLHNGWRGLIIRCCDNFYQDFSGEQDTVVAANKWKAHYAVTKAVADANKTFYKKFKAKSLRGMSKLWLQADYVKCIHPGGELLSG